MKKTRSKKSRDTVPLSWELLGLALSLEQGAAVLEWKVLVGA